MRGEESKQAGSKEERWRRGERRGRCGAHSLLSAVVEDLYYDGGDDGVSAVGAPGRLAVPLRPGSVLLFSSLLPHGTPPNRSERRRRALQWHFALRGAPRVTDIAREVIFGSTGKSVEC